MKVTYTRPITVDISNITELTNLLKFCSKRDTDLELPKWRTISFAKNGTAYIHGNKNESDWIRDKYTIPQLITIITKNFWFKLKQS